MSVWEDECWRGYECVHNTTQKATKDGQVGPEERDWRKHAGPTQSLLGPAYSGVLHCCGAPAPLNNYLQQRRQQPATEAGNPHEGYHQAVTVPYQRVKTTTLLVFISGNDVCVYSGIEQGNEILSQVVTGSGDSCWYQVGTHTLRYPLVIGSLRTVDKTRWKLLLRLKSGAAKLGQQI